MNGQPLAVAGSPVAGEAGQTTRCGPLAYAGGDALTLYFKKQMIQDILSSREYHTFGSLHFPPEK